RRPIRSRERNTVQVLGATANNQSVQSKQRQRRSCSLFAAGQAQSSLRTNSVQSSSASNMDHTDQNSSNPPPDDIEQNFLTQFSSMVTTDKEELVLQFQSIGGNVNHSTATFFLDMTNWNLQAAVGCYFDFMSQNRQPSMKLLNDITVGKGEKLTPSTAIKLTWLLENNGDIAWPYGSYISLRRNPSMMQENFAPSYEDLKYVVPSVLPNDTVTVSVQLVSPSTEGFFETVWSIYTPNGTSFGENIISRIEVSLDGTMATTQQFFSAPRDPTDDPNPQQSTADSQLNEPDDSEMWG
uniref:N_BRCA1_IG domain-containing protein n=1 Tax=Anopheles minimus TaxID=112268 RepID=A0A182W5J5_9DIPT